MPILDFREIPQANVADGQQDTFELFSREFLEMLGYQIIDGPDRGADGGRDLIVREQLNGVLRQETFDWVVSCKHKAHSGQSVGDSDEQNISDRILQHQVQGFMGVYSTIISSGLRNRLNNLPYKNKIFDKGSIEQLLFNNDRGRFIAQRYFPQSYSAWERTLIANLLPKYQPLICPICGQDLLTDRNGIIVLIRDPNIAEYRNIKSIYWSCMGNQCELITADKYSQEGIETNSYSITELVIPSRYLDWLIDLLKKVREKEYIFNDIAFQNLRLAIVSLAQLVFRNQNEAPLRELNLLEALNQ